MQAAEKAAEETAKEAERTVEKEANLKAAQQEVSNKMAKALNAKSFSAKTVFSGFAIIASVVFILL